jgi:hypothetical protein
MPVPKYGLRLGEKGEWLTAPRRMIAHGVTTSDPTLARVWKSESGAYNFRAANPDVKKKGFIVRPIIVEPVNA